MTGDQVIQKVFVFNHGNKEMHIDSVFFKLIFERKEGCQRHTLSSSGRFKKILPFFR